MGVSQAWGVEILEQPMTHDCSRIFNILSDWALLEAPNLGPLEIFTMESLRAVLRAHDGHSQRLSFAVSLMLGIPAVDCLDGMERGSARLRIESVLERCSMRAARIKISQYSILM
jgi:hypothetical protein